MKIMKVMHLEMLMHKTLYNKCVAAYLQRFCSFFAGKDETENCFQCILLEKNNTQQANISFSMIHAGKRLERSSLI